MAERDIRKALKARVESYGGEVRAVSWLGRRSAPDVLCLFFDGTPFAAFYWTGGNVFVETKATDGVLTPAQAREHRRMRAAGCKVRVISTLAQLDEWLPPRA